MKEREIKNIYRRYYLTISIHNNRKEEDNNKPQIASFINP